MMQSLQKDILDHTMNKHQSHFSASGSSEVVADQQQREATKRTEARTLVWIPREKLQDLINFAHIQCESMVKSPIKTILPLEDSSTDGGGGGDGESGLLRAKSSLAIISSKLNDILGGASALTKTTTSSTQHDTITLKRKSGLSQDKGGCEIISSSSSSSSTSKKNTTSKAPGHEKLLAEEEEEESIKTAVSKGNPVGTILRPMTKAGQSSQELQGTGTAEPLSYTGTTSPSSKKLPAKTVHKSSNITSRTKAVLKDKSNNTSMNASTTKDSKNKLVSKRAGGTKSLTPANQQVRKLKEPHQARSKSGTKNDKACQEISSAGQKRPPGTISSTFAQLPPKRHNHTVVNASGNAPISQHPPDGREKVVPTSASWHPFEDSIIVHCWKSCLDHSLSPQLSWISMVQERLAGRSAYEIQHRFTHFHQKRLVAEQGVLMSAAARPTNIHSAATGSIDVLPHRRTLTGKRSSDMDAAAGATITARNPQRHIASENSRTIHASAATAVQQRPLATKGSHKGVTNAIQQHQLGSGGDHKDTTAACCPIQPRPSTSKNSQRNPTATTIVPQPPPELTSTNSRMLVGAADATDADADADATTQQYQLASDRSHRGDPTVAPTTVQHHLATNNSHVGASTVIHQEQFFAGGSSSHIQPHSKIAQKSPWTASDDARLLYCYKVYCGSGDIKGWKDIERQFPGRSELECQLRYRLLHQVAPQR